MRVAFCFYGQSRTFQVCSELNRQWFQKLRDLGFDLDFYIHTWTENCGGVGQDNRIEQDKDQLELNLQEEYNPVCLEIDNFNKILLRYPGFLGKIKDRTVGFIYSHSRVLQQVIEECRKQGKFYDHIITLRMDQWFPKGFTIDELREPLQGLSIRSIDGSVVPENRYNLQDHRDIASIRDEGFWMNYETAEKVATLFQWLYSDCKVPRVLTRDELSEFLEVPETVFAIFFSEKGIKQEGIGTVRDRVIIREPVDKLIDITNKDHIQILYEIREWVDWSTKNQEIFRRFTELRVSGVTLHQALKAITCQSGINFLDNWGKQKRFENGN